MCDKKVTLDSYINSPWGKIAYISWGNPENPPVLMMHGYMDTAATFTFLVDKLSDKYYYVSVDIPGHGKSDPLPPGILINKLHVVETIRIVVEQMKWDSFTFVSHSMSCMIGIFYNTFHPGIVNKMIFLDPKPTLAWYFLIHHQPHMWYRLIYDSYYDFYEKLHSGKQKLQDRESWINLVARNRSITKEQGEVVLSRSFISTGNNIYRLSWEQRVKYLAHIAIPIETFNFVVSKLPPTLAVNASEYSEFVNFPGATEYATNLINGWDQSLPHFNMVTVNGGHDFHISNPEGMVECIEDFLASADLKKSKQ